MDFSSYYNENVEQEMIKKMEQEQQNSFWRPKKDKSVLRILPPVIKNGEKLFYHAHKVHWINKRPYECLNQTLVDKDGHEHVACDCPICKFVNKLYKAGDDESKSLASKISAKTKYVVRVIVRDENDNQPVFYEMGNKIHQLITGAAMGGEFGSIISPVNGRDFNLVKKGEGTNTDYSGSYISPNVSKIFNEDEKILEALKKAQSMPYNQLISFQDADTLRKVIAEMDDTTSISPIVGTPMRTPAPVHNIGKPTFEEPFADAEDLIPPMSQTNESTGNSELDDLLAELEGNGVGF